MNALQRLIQDYLDEHPGETFASISRRAGMPYQTVQALRYREQARQTPRPETIRKLAKGLETTEDTVRSAAGLAAGYGQGQSAEPDDRLRLLVSQLAELDDERFRLVALRARTLLAEMHEEEATRGPARRPRRRAPKRDPKGDA